MDSAGVEGRQYLSSVSGCFPQLELDEGDKMEQNSLNQEEYAVIVLMALIALVLIILR